MRNYGKQVSSICILSLQWLFIPLLCFGETKSLQFQVIENLSLDYKRAAEIVQYYPKRKLILATNPRLNEIDIYHIDDFNRMSIRLLVPKGKKTFIDTDSEPTSIAVHPSLPFALVTVLGDPHSPGRLVGLDLRKGKLGRKVLDQSIGIDPDSVAISPNGQLAIVANEAEDDPLNRGSIYVIDLSTLKMDKTASQKLSIYKLTGLSKLLGKNVRPEFVAFDPKSRLATVTCQRNDAVAIIDIRTNPPRLVNAIRLPELSGPDGIDVLDSIIAPDGKTGCLVGIAEEGYAVHGKRGGQTISFYWVDPNDLEAPPVFISRLDTRPLICPDKPYKRIDPEGIAMMRFNNTPFAFVGMERTDCVIALNLTDAKSPHLATGIAKTGHRPEGVIGFIENEILYIITGNEKDKTGNPISIIRVYANIE